MTIPISNMTATWNDGGTVFTGLKLNVTNIASAAGSALLDLQIGGNSQFTALRTGEIVCSALCVLLGATGYGVGYEGGVVLVQGGVEKFKATTSTVLIPQTSSYGWAVSGGIVGDSTGDTFLFKDGTAGIIAQRNSTNAQTLRVYNTFTDANNYEHGVFDWNSVSNVLVIGTKAAGTGTARDVYIQASGIEAGSQYFRFSGSTNNLLFSATGTNASLDLGSTADQVFVVTNTFGIGSIEPSSCGFAIAGGGGSTTGSFSFGRVFNNGGSSDHQVNWTWVTHVDDKPAQGHKWICQAAYSAASTNLVGGDYTIIGGDGSSGSSGLATGGNVFIKGGAGFGTGFQGSVVLGTGAINAASTDGFIYIPTCAGTPSGTPTTQTGKVAMIYDTTNHQFWFYDSGWKQPKTPAGAATVTWQ